MKFIKLTIENYKSFQYPTVLNFPHNEEGKSIFLIGGMNGAGKTSLLEAINICLYGAKLDEIYNCINTKELEKGNAFVSIELEFETEENENIIVNRSWSAGSTATPKSKDLSEKLVVVKDGKRVSVQNKDLWQDYINTTIPKPITQFFFFDGEKIQEIAGDNYTELKLKSSLEAALGINFVTQLTQDIVTLRQEEKKGFVDISDEDIAFKESELKKENKNLENKNKEIIELEEELNIFKEQKDDAQNQFKAIFNIDPVNSEHIKQQEKRKIQLSSKISQLDLTIKNLTEDFLPFALGANLFDAIKSELEIEANYNKNSAVSENASQLIEKIIIQFNEPFPITEVKLNEDQKAQLKNRLLNVFESNQQDDVTLIHNLSNNDTAKVLNKIEEIEQSDVLDLTNLIQEKEELELEFKNLEYTSASLTNTVDKETFEELQNTIESCNTQIGRIAVKLSNAKDDMVFIQKRINDIELELSKLYDKHGVSRDRALFIEECDTISKLLMSYVAKLRRNKIESLQNKTFEMYKLLSSKSSLLKELTINQKTFEITITDRNNSAIKKSGLSAGEKEIFAISLLWGLAQTSEIKLPIIIDTPLSRLDSVHRDNIINNYFPNAASQVIILSTDTEIDSNYFNQLKPNLTGAARLEFSPINQITTVNQGYFW
ncbi:DNA sulfur modification protein DndD [Myroides sp. C15-4]|uniref:DNA sulfur modification protein DndD n=1 Tax=Myroides sp. C15-4 TaxID=3400532 RepID=UPI003D2F584B